MSNFEIFLIITACALPIVALFFVLPKFKKKEKKVPAPIKTFEELKKEEAAQEVKEQPTVIKPVEKAFVNTEFTSDDFKSYLSHKQRNTTKPNKVEFPDGFIDRTSPYMPRRRRRIEEKPKTVAEEIQNLSPELKALIISGVLEPKNFDKY